MARGRKRRGALKVIPNPPILQKNAIMNHADNVDDLLGIDSAIDEQIGYITDKREFLIVSEVNGYLRLPVNVMREVLKEALECMEVLK